MKKITMMIALLGPAFLWAQDANLDVLLHRLSEAGSQHIAEPTNLFTAEEELQLRTYFDAKYGTEKESTAVGDVYGVQIRLSCTEYFVDFPLAGPFDFQSQFPTFTDVFSGDFAGDGTLYGAVSDVDNSIYQLITIDKVTGVETVIGNLTDAQAGGTVGGLAWNEVNNTMYALVQNPGTLTQLYTIDLSTAAMTYIGDTQLEAGVWLAINKDGDAYYASTDTDSLYKIDLDTADDTLIGPLGIDINFAQDADFDYDTGTLYMAAYFGGGINQMASVDLATGTATTLGTVNGDCAEMGMIAIQGSNLSVEDNAIEEFQVLPNPVNDFMTLRSGSSLDNVTIYNLQGQKVWFQEINATEITIDLTRLAVGMYIAQVKSQGKINTQKVIKK